MATKGRPRLLTPETIGKAVSEVGFENLTFATVQVELGVGKSTLFRYVNSREELLRMGMDYIADRLKWPPISGPWKEALFAQAMFAWNEWGKYPGIATEASQGIYPKAMLHKTIEITAYLIKSGFTLDQAILASDAIFDLVMDNRRGLEQMDKPRDNGETARQSLVEELGQELISHLDGETANIQKALLQIVNVTPEDWIVKKLQLMLDGIEQQIV